MMTKIKNAVFLLAVASVFFLSACGGSDNFPYTSSSSASSPASGAASSAVPGQ
jgi:hypothetical protein